MTTQETSDQADLAEVLRRAARLPSARVVVSGRGHAVSFAVGAQRIAPLGTAPEPPCDQLAAALVLTSAAITVTPDDSGPVIESLAEQSIDVETALAEAQLMAGSWADVLAVVPDEEATVRLVGSLPPGGVELEGQQWRVLARIGRGRTVGELAELLDLGHMASRRTIYALVSAGLVRVVLSSQPAFAPPIGPALAAPEPRPSAAPEPVVSAEVPDLFDLSDACDEPVASERSEPAPPLWGDLARSGDSGWVADVPPATPSADGWAEAEVFVPRSSWDDFGQLSSPEAAWPDGSTTSFASRAETASDWDDRVPFTPSATRAAPRRDDLPRHAPVDVAFTGGGEIGDASAATGPSDEVLGSVIGEDELVNRALLFKFLSSVRD